MQEIVIQTSVLTFNQAGNFSNLFAYLDPGSGSLLIQLIIGAAAGVAYTLRTQIGNFIRLITGKSQKESEEKKDNGEKGK
jgi:hypothetical protein